MADDQSSKATSIDDLVRELSKSSTSPGTPPAPQAPRPPFPTPKPPILPSINPPLSPKPLEVPKPLEMPKPKFNIPPQPFSQPSQPKPTQPPAPFQPPGVKEYQSSIRTMNEDISKIKQGQKPTGIEIPRKIEQVAPVPQVIPPKPAVPSQQFKVPSVNLGEAQKTGPLAQSRDFSKPPTAPKVDSKPQIYVPEGGQKSDNRNLLFIGIGAVAIVAGFSYWFFVLRSPAPEVVIESPTPFPTATPIQDLNSIFSGINTENVSVKDPSADLNTNIKTLAINGGEFKNLNVTSESKGQFTLGLLDFLAKPAQPLVDNMGADHKIFLYGQKESFDTKGQLKTNAVVGKRLVFVNEVKDVVAAFQIAKNWETSMNEDLKFVFEFDPKKQQSKDFGDNSYRGVNVRYKNFKYADKSIDYAIVPASNGKSYLVISGSREAMYATINKLKGF